MTVVSRLLVIDRQKPYVEWDMGGLRVAHILFILVITDSPNYGRLCIARYACYAFSFCRCNVVLPWNHRTILRIRQEQNPRINREKTITITFNKGV